MKVDNVELINFTLRKSFLRELNLLRETYDFQKQGLIDKAGAEKFHKSHLFDFDLGLDERICDLLKIKIKQVQVEYVNTINEQKRRIEELSTRIEQYKMLTPKTFALMDLSLDEIFGGVAIIYKDAFEIFDSFEKAFPRDYFVGAIEEKFGAFFDKDMIRRLENEIDRITMKFEKD